MSTPFRVPRMWPGATIACIATGPSLTDEDCSYVCGKVPVIAINDAHRLAPWSDVLYSSDRTWWKYYEGVPSFAGVRIGIGSAAGKCNRFHGLATEIAVMRNTGLEGLELDPTGLRTARNSGYSAINLAVHFGAARILLLGYNMGFRNGRAHWFGDHPTSLSQNESLFATHRQSFEQLIEPLRSLGVEVINCTPETSLNTFPVRPLREVLPARMAVAS